MFIAFQLKNHCLSTIDRCDNEFVPLSGSIWIDLVNPTDCEYRYIYTELGENLIKFLQSSNIHKTLYFFQDKDILYVRLFFLYEEDSNNNMSGIVTSFIVCDDRLYTFSDKNISIFRCYQICNEQYPLIYGDVYTLLLTLFEISLDYLSDKIKFLYKKLESLSLVVAVGLKICEYDKVLSHLACLESIGRKIRLSLLDIQRVVNFLAHKISLSLSDYNRVKDLSNYIECLSFHNNSLFKEIHFLIEVTMNFISIEQNRIIKILSVIFLPPTLVASSYGMNFEFMPELRWSLGYPAAIVLMILSGLAPYFYFKYKKWL